MLLNGVLLSCWSELCKSCTVFVVCLVFSFYYFIHIIIVMAAEHGSATGSATGSDFGFLNPLKRSPLVEKSRISWQIQVFIREETESAQ